MRMKRVFLQCISVSQKNNFNKDKLGERMKKLIAFIAAGVALLIVSACSIFPSPRTIKMHYYDIGFPAKQYKLKIAMQVLPCIGGVGNETRMISRKASNSVQFDPFNRWANSPSKLIQSYLSLALSNDKTQIEHSIAGEILRFEGDLVNKTANIAIKITIKSNRKNKDKEAYLSQVVYSASVPVEKETATAYAVGMEKAMAEITQQIVKNIQKIKKK